jgi:hypothetical protein
MTDERLAELEGLARAATPGPWEVETTPRPSGTGVYRRGLTITSPGKPNRTYPHMPGIVAMIGGSSSFENEPALADADRDFIAAARTAVPELVAEVRRLRADLARCEENDPHWFAMNVRSED